jgi:two-component system chemotaxis sensor kinase CheA
VEMPGMDGFSFVEQVRADPQLRATPAILVTSRASANDQQRGRDVGAQGYIIKSEFDQGALLDRIRTLLR